MTEWVKYTGSDEQIKELWCADAGYLLRFSDKVNDRIRRAKEAWLTVSDFSIHCKKVTNVTHYLICDPHPLADMICQQACTGQPVWVRVKGTVSKEHWRCNQLWTVKTTAGGVLYSYLQTTEPNWDIPGAEYRFTQFED